MEYRLLGPVEVMTDTGPVRLGSAKQRSLLAVLALSVGRAVTVERLVDALWGEHPPEDAAGALRFHVHRLRKALAPVGADIVTRPGGYVLDAEPGAIDLVQVDRLCSEGRRVVGSDPAGAAGLFRRALDLWRGPPLADVAGEPFAGPEIARLEELHRSLTERWLTAELDAGGEAPVVAELERLVGVEPLDEHWWALLMLALYRAGRQADALAAYQQVRAVLAEELGLDPSPELRQLEARILAQEPTLDRTATGSPGEPVLSLPAALAALASEPFVGRTGAMDALGSAWTRAADGERQVVLVAGEPGIGKTALVARVAAEAQRAGAVVLYGRNDEDNLLSYQPFVEVLDQLESVLGEGQIEVVLGDALGDVAPLLPRLRHRPSAELSLEQADPDHARYLMFEAVRRLLATTAERAPLVLVLDDLHWADAPTLRLLRHLVREAERIPLLVVGTYRDTDLDRAHPLAGVLADLRREAVVERVHLGGLDAGEVGALVAVLGGAGPDEVGASLAAVVHEETEGNPFFVREVLRHLVESGVLDRRDGRWTSDVAVEEVGIPEGVREVIGRRLSRLGESTNRVLAAASVLGREFSLAALAPIVGVGEDDLLDAVDRAVGASLVDEVPGAADRYAFTHALVRRALYDELTAGRRARLHRRAAETLEAAGGAPRLGEIAHHYLEAGDSVVAVDHARRAAADAMGALAYEEAARLVQAALDAIGVDSPDGRLRVELLLDLGRARWAAGDPTWSATSAAAVDEARDLGDTDLFVRAVLLRVGATETGDNTEPARALLAEALEALGPGPSPTRAVLLAREAGAWAYISTVDPAGGVVAVAGRVRAELMEASEVAGRCGDAVAMAQVARAKVAVQWTYGTDLEEHRLAVDELERLAAEAGDLELVHHAGWRQVVLAMTLGELDRADQLLTAFEEMVARSRIAVSCHSALMLREFLCLALGRLADAAAADQAARDLARRTRTASPAGATLHYWVAMLVRCRMTGGLEDLVEPTRAMVELLPMFQPLRCVLAYLYAELEQPDEALATAASVDHDAAAPGVGPPANLSLLAETAWLTGDEALAIAVRHRLVARAVPNVMLFQLASLGSPERFLGSAAAAAADLDAAVAHLRAAIDANGRMGAAPWTAEAQARLAEVLVRRDAPGDREEAARIAAEAHAAARRIGMTRLVEHLQAGGWGGAGGPERRAGS